MQKLKDNLNFIQNTNQELTNKSKRKLKFFNSWKEQDDYNRYCMAQLTPLERLQNLRSFINLAYGMHRYDPSNLPKIHLLRFSKNNKNYNRNF